MEQREEAFDAACLSVITYLRTFDEAVNINFRGSERASQSELDAWEKQNLPYKLPEDLRAFLCIFNGFSLTYGAEVGGSTVPVGTLFLNPLSKLVRVPIEGSFPPGMGWNMAGAQASLNCAGFSLDSTGATGNMVLLYRGASRSCDSFSGNNGSSGDGSSDSYGSSIHNGSGVEGESASLSAHSHNPKEGGVPVKGPGVNTYENPEVRIQCYFFYFC